MTYNNFSANTFGHQVENLITNGINTYKIGTEIGRGAFAMVFQAMNVCSGDFVALKRFPVNSVENDIESEIELMQRLDHPNIVKYIDTVKSSSYLYIVLEFMESGSLSSVVKAFGCDEARSALYISQVLKGLKYLHNQGVLHRDLKAANILTNKQGHVKLADFGVATKLSSENSNDDIPILGSPYWMAPEIIEMNAPTSACDIWSIGCIAVELLTGSPPYFHLTPPAALYRIASDDHPPIPESISPALQDFIMLCFQKEPAMRASASKLLEHPWITNHLKPNIGKTITPKNIDLDQSILFDSDDDDNKRDRSLRAVSYDSYANRKNPSVLHNFRPDASLNITTHSIIAESNSDTEFNFEVSHSHHDQDIDDDVESGDSLIIDDDDFDSVFEYQAPSVPQNPTINSGVVNKFSSKTGKIKALTAYQDDGGDINEDDFADISANQKDKTQAKLDAPTTNVFFSNANQINFSQRKNINILSSASFSKQKLDETLKRNTVEETDGSFDQFQFDDIDFRENEPNYIPLRRSREIVDLMSRIKNCYNEADLHDIGMKIIDFFDNPEQRKHLVTCHGVMAVFDMYEPKSSSINLLASPTFNNVSVRNGGGSFFPETSHQINTNKNSNMTSVMLYNTIPSRVYINMVLRITNKIIEEPLAQEQLAYLGIIPIIMSIFEKSCTIKDSYKSMIPFTPRDNLSQASPTSTNSSSKNSSPQSTSPINSSNSNIYSSFIPSSNSHNPSVQANAFFPPDYYNKSSSIEDLTLESVKFIYQISLQPSLLKLLIGAGGLNVITTMVGFHSKLETDRLIADLQSSLHDYKGINSTINTESISAEDNTTPKNASASKLKVAHLKLDLNLSPSPSNMLPPLPLTQSFSSELDDSRGISIFEMGLSSVKRVLIQSSRPRDFYRLFVKIGLLTHLFESFDTLLCRYRSLLNTKVWSLKTLEKIIKQQQEFMNSKINRKNSTVNVSSFSISPSAKSNQSPTPADSTPSNVDDIIGSFGDIVNVDEDFNEDDTQFSHDLENNLNDFDSDFEDEVFNLENFNNENENISFSSLVPTEFNKKFCSLQFRLNSHLYTCEQFLYDLVNLIFKFSRSDGIVAENIVKSNEGSNIKIILSSIENLRESFNIANQIDIIQESLLQELGWTSISSFTGSDSHNNSSFQKNHHKVDFKSVATANTIQSLQTYLSMQHNSCYALASTLTPTQYLLDFLLKSLRLLSLEPSTLDDLDALGSTDKLVELFIEINTSHTTRSSIVNTTLTSSSVNSLSNNQFKFLPEILNHQILPTLFNLLRLHPRRQEKAAVLGIVNPLIHTIITDSSSSSLLRQFALPILSDLTKASNVSRQVLLNCNVVSKFCEWLNREEVYWQTFALNSLSIWISYDMEKVSRVLILPHNLTKLIEFFHTVSNSTLTSLHKALLDMHKSAILCESLSVSGIYINALVRRLNTTTEAIVRKSLLRIVQYLHQHHSISSRQYILNYNLYVVIKNLSRLDDQVLVSELANRLLTDFQFSTLT